MDDYSVLLNKLNELESEVKNLRSDNLKFLSLYNLIVDYVNNYDADYIHKLKIDRDLRDLILDFSLEDGLSTLISRKLIRAGIYTIEDFKYLDLHTLKEIRQIGKFSIEQINKFLVQSADLKLPEKWDQYPELPSIKTGDIVRSLVDSSLGKKGTEISVDKILPVMRHPGCVYRALPVYKCINSYNQSKYFSVSQIYKRG